jgi:hypothetical protein
MRQARAADFSSSKLSSTRTPSGSRTNTCQTLLSAARRRLSNAIGQMEQLLETLREAGLPAQ